MHRHGDVSFDLKCFLKQEVNCKITRLDFGKWHVAATTLLTFVRWGDQTSLLIWIEMNNLLHDGIIFLTELIFADAKNWLHRTATDSNTYTRIWRKVVPTMFGVVYVKRMNFALGSQITLLTCRLSHPTLILDVKTITIGLTILKIDIATGSVKKTFKKTFSIFLPGIRHIRPSNWKLLWTLFWDGTRILPGENP